MQNGVWSLLAPLESAKVYCSFYFWYSWQRRIILEGMSQLSWTLKKMNLERSFSLGKRQFWLPQQQLQTRCLSHFLLEFERKLKMAGLCESSITVSWIKQWPLFSSLIGDPVYWTWISGTNLDSVKSLKGMCIFQPYVLSCCMLSNKSNRFLTFVACFNQIKSHVFLLRSNGCGIASKLEHFSGTLDNPRSIFLVDGKAPDIVRASTLCVSSPKKSLIYVRRLIPLSFAFPNWLWTHYSIL